MDQSRGNIFRRGDPPDFRPRNLVMILCDAPLSGPPISPSQEGMDVTPKGSAAVKEAHAVQDPVWQDPPYSAQTAWLLAVRDHRDRAAYAKLFAYFGPRLKAMLLRSGLRDGRAEDVVQEVMLAVWHKAAQFDPNRAEASGWIYRIARNRHIDLIRRGPVAEEELIEAHFGQEPDGFHLLALQEENRALRSAIAALAPEQSQLLQKAFFEDMPHSEISSLTGLPLGTIKSRIRLGLARIRRDLAELRQS